MSVLDTFDRLLRGERSPVCVASESVMSIMRPELHPVGPYCAFNPTRNYNVKRRKRPVIEHTVTPLRRRA